MDTGWKLGGIQFLILVSVAHFEVLLLVQEGEQVVDLLRPKISMLSPLALYYLGEFGHVDFAVLVKVEFSPKILGVDLLNERVQIIVPCPNLFLAHIFQLLRTQDIITIGIKLQVLECYIPTDLATPVHNQN